MDKFRRTGRTTKMLNNAIWASKTGFSVSVIAWNHQQKNYFSYYFGLKNIINIEVLNYNHCDHIIDWYQFSLRRTSKNHKLFFDHTIIETRFPQQVANDYNFLMSVIDN